MSEQMIERTLGELIEAKRARRKRPFQWWIGQQAMLEIKRQNVTNAVTEGGDDQPPRLHGVAVHVRNDWRWGYCLMDSDDLGNLVPRRAR